MIGKELPWAEFKAFVDARVLSIQWVELNNTYYMTAIDGPFNFRCSVYKDDGADQLEFEGSYKDLGNKSPRTEVVTQNEKNDKILKLASREGSFVDGACTISIKIPGTPGSGEGRWVAGGYAFTNVWTAGDRVTLCQVVDTDDLMGYGAGTVLKTYHDTDVDASDLGWRMWPAQQVGGEIEIDPIGGYGFIPAGLYLEIKFELAAGSTATWVCCDYWWAKSE
jgi:hypothetical protein